MNKDSFIEALTCMTREEIAKYIKEKGKEPKMIKPFIVFPYDNDIKDTIKGGKYEWIRMSDLK